MKRKKYLYKSTSCSSTPCSTEVMFGSLRFFFVSFFFAFVFVFVFWCFFCLLVWVCWVYCAPLQRYKAMLCTIDLRCAPSSSIVHHGAEEGPIFFKSRGHPQHFHIAFRLFTSYIQNQGSQCSSDTNPPKFIHDFNFEIFRLVCTRFIRPLLEGGPF